MFGVDQQHEVLGEKGLNAQLFVVDREVNDRGVDLARHQPGEQAGRSSLGDDGANIGVGIA